ncbi:MAG: DUF512 domain-containing protein [Oscillospiraceae bacterium]|nr:DUF512 domain-containing protein [Oscillospiraceae bacterium]
MSAAIKSVQKGSPAARSGMHPGETLLSVNGKIIHDVLDYQYYTYDRKLSVELKGQDGKIRKVRVRKVEGEPLGLEFETYLMDHARSCANNCIFCFVDQLPKGLRESLYFKDDDARLSFLMGNYITLTNLSERELQRIIDLRISPLNLSVHATNPELRAKLLGNPRGGETLKWLERFAHEKITLNCQIVSCPGVNDGPELVRTMQDLARLYPGVNSVSIVPVGLTRHREGLYPLFPYTSLQAAAVVDQVESFGADCRKKTGSTLFFCSDEFYLLAGRPLPSEDYYEGYPQLENGVGMLRRLCSEFESALEENKPAEVPAPFSIATGLSAAPFLQELMDRLKADYPQMVSKVYPVVNHFFGETIVVAGLLTGQDLIAQLKGRDLGERLLLPVNMLRHGQDMFLDDVTIKELKTALGVPVVPVAQDGYELLKAIAGDG